MQRKVLETNTRSLRSVRCVVVRFPLPDQAELSAEAEGKGISPRKTLRRVDREAFQSNEQIVLEVAASAATEDVPFFDTAGSGC